MREQEPVYRVMYVSRPTARTDEERRAQISDVLTVARPANQARSLTGALFHCPSWFGQVLEGPLGNLEKTLASIHDDPRHTSVRILDIARISNRVFTGWEMAEVNDFDPSRFEEIVQRITHEGGLTDPALGDFTSRLLSSLASAARHAT